MRLLPKLFAVAVVAVAPVAQCQDLDRKLIRDRNGVVLVETSGISGRQYPWQAMAAQLLVGLQPDTAKHPGPHIDLTIDARIQFITEQALRAVPRGAAVVIDPNNGDILAMASLPSFDPAHSVASTLTADATEPQANRALRETAPGAVFMVVTGLAGMTKGIMNQTYECRGAVTYGGKTLKCWLAPELGGHGALTLGDALRKSCGPFFFQYGNAAGIDEIVRTGKLLGLGEQSSLPLGNEDAGVLPGPEWLRTVSPEQRWSDGYTANVAIGQGAVAVTPLQMAMVAATIANGGSSHFPRLLLNEPVRLRSDLRKQGWTAEQIELIRKGMWRVVNEAGGRGARARLAGTTVAGKPGTAQFWRHQDGKHVADYCTWFIAFAPYDNPKFAVCVMVEGAKSGGAVAAPIAGKIFEGCFAEKSALRIEPLKPAAGSFAPVESLGD